MYLKMLAIFLGCNVDRAVVAVGLKPGRSVIDQVTAANQVAHPIKRFLQRQNVSGEHRFSSTAFGENFKDFIGVGSWTCVFSGAERVNGHARSFRVLNALLEASVTGSVLAVAQNNQDFCHSFVVRVRSQLPAGGRHGVKEGGSSAIREMFNTSTKFGWHSREILRDGSFTVEPGDEAQIRRAVENSLEEPRCRALFERESILNRATGVDQQPQAQRKLGLGNELQHTLWWLVVIADLDVGKVQTADHVAVVAHGEEQRGFIDYRANRPSRRSHCGFVLVFCVPVCTSSRGAYFTGRAGLVLNGVQLRFQPLTIGE